MAHMQKKRNAYRVLVRKCKGQRQLGRCGLMWKDDVKIDLKEVGYEGMDWIYLA